MQRLSLQQARNLHLAAQGLLRPTRARARPRSVIDAVARMRLLQIDTIHVVARSPYLVLLSRLGDYDPRWLDDALAQAALFECWAHEACFACIDELPLHRHPSPLRGGHWAHKQAERLQQEHSADIRGLLDHIRVRGAVKSSDFERQVKSAGGWWNRSLEKRWLEAAFVLGQLMVARRDNFQRVYDLTERVLARVASVTTEARMQEADIRREFVVGAVRALGITQARWIDDYFRLRHKVKDSVLDGLVDSGELVRVDVSGWDEIAYVHRDHSAVLARAQRGGLRATHTTVLSPFDPVVWHRERASTMFGFDYTIECYLPDHKRRFGYFVLPILHRGRLIGRMDAKAHRVNGEFEIKSLFVETGGPVDASITAELALAIDRCARWHRTPRVVVRHCEPRAWAAPLRAALRQATIAGEGATVDT